MDTNKQETLLSEAAAARHAGVALGTMQRARRNGKVTPKQEMLTGFGVVRLYSPDEVKAYFTTDAEFLASRKSRQPREAATQCGVIS